MYNMYILYSTYTVIMTHSTFYHLDQTRNSAESEHLIAAQDEFARKVTVFSVLQELSLYLNTLNFKIFSISSNLYT